LKPWEKDISINSLESAGAVDAISRPSGCHRLEMVFQGRAKPIYRAKAGGLGSLGGARYRNLT
jgi:hypothetical protein